MNASRFGLVQSEWFVQGCLTISAMANPTKTALITGITGQDGSYLAELLLAKGYVVHGVVRPTSKTSRIAHLVGDAEIGGQRLFLHHGELSNVPGLSRIISDVQPAEIYHLAGQSHVGRSFEIPESTLEEVGVATMRLLETVRAHSPSVKFYHASSAEVFGRATETPQTAETPFRPVTPYGCAKAFATQLARVYRESYGLFICNGILYNHESPRRGETFVTRKISRAVARIARGLDRELVLGDLESRRDWGRAADYVVAMWMMLQHDRPDDYIVATGETHSVREFVELAFAAVDLPWEKYVKHDPAFDRPADSGTPVGSTTKIREALGWEAGGTFPQLVREMVEADLALVDSEATAR